MKLEELLLRLKEPVAKQSYSDEPELGELLERIQFLGLAKERPAATKSGAEDELPRRVGQYELLRLIRRGGMGVVYQAVHIELGRRVAVKELSVAGRSDTALRRFQRELLAAGMLKHPHIVHATDAGREPERFYLVMELLSGLDLQRIIRRCGRLRPQDAAELIRQATLGLEHAAQEGFCHRDVKPSNLFLTDDGIVKVLDLGLAQVDASEQSALTRSGAFLGSLDYVSPEQATDPRSADQRSDIYSLGCTLYELLSSAAPFRDYSSAHKLWAHARERPEQLRDLTPEFGAGIEAVCARMLEKQRERRFHSYPELREALEPFCSGADLQALLSDALSREDVEEDDAPEVLRAPRERRSGLWVLAIAALATLALAVPSLFPEANSGDEVPRERRKESQLHIASSGVAPAHGVTQPRVPTLEDFHVSESLLRLKPLGTRVEAIHNDFEGDKKSDLVLVRRNFPTVGHLAWLVLTSSSWPPKGEGWERHGEGFYCAWGHAEWPIVPGDYDGDAMTDLGVIVPGFTRWRVSCTRAENLDIQHGLETDVFVPAYFDGDINLDPTFYRPSTGQWVSRLSRNGELYASKPAIAIPPEAENVEPFVANINGDRYSDAGFRYTLGNDTVYALHVSTALESVEVRTSVGTVLVVGDYNGDGAKDLAFFTAESVPAKWFVFPLGEAPFVLEWGRPGDEPVVGDFDGDGVYDPCVWRAGEPQDCGSFLLKCEERPSSRWTPLPGGGYSRVWGFVKDRVVP